MDEEGAKAIYDRLSNDRAPYITRAEKNAQYTIPSLFPKASDNGSTDYPTPYQSVGARGLNNLAAKLVLSTVPVGEPFHRLTISEFDVKEQGAQTGEEGSIMDKAQVGLSMVERIVTAHGEASGLRPTASELMKQLLVAGNGLMHLPPGEAATKLYRLSSYVVERDAVGQVLQTLAVDRVAFVALPEDLKNSLPNTDYEPNELIEIITHCYRDLESDGWLEYQEVEGEVVQGSENTYPVDANPWIPVRLYKLDGENYGRSFVEEYIGDLVSLENISKSIVQFAIACSKILFLVKPGSATSVRRVAKANSGDFVPGRKEDIEVFQMEKFADFQIVEKVGNNIEQRLSFAFLLNSAVQRSGDRVTAEEIRYVSQELEATLGGVYSVLATEFQLPLVRRWLVDLQATGKIPDLPTEALKPQIITGIDAIGRGQDQAKLSAFQAMIQPFVDKVSARVDWDNLLLRAANATGLDPSGMILTDQQMQQRAAQTGIAQGMVAGGTAAGQAAGANLGAGATDPEAMAQAMGG
ncbi:putative head to tail joining protein [Ralstonia phage RpT1]|nr:putative head to tail joining protein [Ralstonia phage RpT1]